MSQSEPTTEWEHVGVPLVPLSVNHPTWRYLGDRSAADTAYCARFGVTEAAEPILVHGVWIYPLPAEAL